MWRTPYRNIIKCIDNNRWCLNARFSRNMLWKFLKNMLYDRVQLIVYDSKKPSVDTFSRAWDNCHQVQRTVRLEKIRQNFTCFNVCFSWNMQHKFLMIVSYKSMKPLVYVGKNRLEIPLLSWKLWASKIKTSTCCRCVF